MSSGPVGLIKVSPTFHRAQASSPACISKCATWRRAQHCARRDRRGRFNMLHLDSPRTASTEEEGPMDVRDWYYLLRAAAQREEGQTMGEYGVVLALITLGVVAALGALAAAITGKFGAVTDILKNGLP